VGATDDQTFRSAVNAVLQSPSPVGSDRTLAWEVSRLVDHKGKPLDKLPYADFTIVKYWSPACKNCEIIEKTERKILQEVLTSYQQMSVNILHAKVDPGWLKHKR
jgi:hypothetical protein